MDFGWPKTGPTRSSSTAKPISTSLISPNDVSSLCSQVGATSIKDPIVQPPVEVSFIRNAADNTGSSSGHSVHQPKHRYSSAQDVIKSYEERLQNPPFAFRNQQGCNVYVHPNAIVHEFPDLGRNAQHPKHAERGRNNPWRRYGALSKMQEMGGLVLVGDRKKKQYEYAQPGTPLTPPPQTPEVTINRDSGRSSPLDGLILARHVPALELARETALLIERLVDGIDGDFSIRSESGSDDKYVTD